MLNIAVWIFKKQMWFHCLYPQITHAKADCETFKYAYTLKCSFAGSPGEGILCGLGKIVHHDGVVLFEEAFWERAFQNQSSPSWSQRLCGGGQQGRVLLCPLGWHMWLWRSPGRDGCSHDLVPAHTPLLCHLSCSLSAALLCSNLCCNTFPVSGSTRGCHQGGSLVRKAAAAPAARWHCQALAVYAVPGGCHTWGELPAGALPPSLCEWDVLHAGCFAECRARGPTCKSCSAQDFIAMGYRQLWFLGELPVLQHGCFSYDLTDMGLSGLVAKKAKGILV